MVPKSSKDWRNYFGTVNNTLIYDPIPHRLPAGLTCISQHGISFQPFHPRRSGCGLPDQPGMDLQRPGSPGRLEAAPGVLYRGNDGRADRDVFVELLNLNLSLMPTAYQPSQPRLYRIGHSRNICRSALKGI